MGKPIAEEQSPHILAITSRRQVLNLNGNVVSNASSETVDESQESQRSEFLQRQKSLTPREIWIANKAKRMAAKKANAGKSKKNYFKPNWSMSTLYDHSGGKMTTVDEIQKWRSLYTWPCGEFVGPNDEDM